MTFAIALCAVSHAQAQCGPAGSVGLASATSLLSALNTVNTAFLTHTNAFVTGQTAERSDQLAGGAWARGIGGEVKVDSQASIVFTGVPGSFACASSGQLDYSGFQIGVDLARLNFASSGTNVHFGLTGGSVHAKGAERGGPASTELDVPFGGIYATLISGGFFADVLARWDFYDMNVSQFQVGLRSQQFNGQALTFSGSAGYHQTFGSWFVEPSVGLISGRLQMDPLAVAGNAAFAVPSGSMVFADIDTFLGRAGLRIGTSFVGQSLVLQPFVAANIWREFADDAAVRFNSGAGTVFNLSTGRVGTYAQYVAGFAAQVPDTGWVGYARVDARQGEKLEAWGVNAGLRYQFK